MYKGLLLILGIIISLPAILNGVEKNDRSLVTVFDSSNGKKAPNVIFIFPDQLRRYSAGFWSEKEYRDDVVGAPDPVYTPSIDRLAKEGVVFTQAISNYPLCSPYRGMFLTGRFPEGNGIWSNCHKSRDYGLKQDVATVTDLFSDAGYEIAYFGKCHWAKTEPLFDTKGNFVGSEEGDGGNYVNAYDTYVEPKDRHSIDYFFQALKDEHFNPHVYSNIPETVAGKSDGELYLPKKYSTKLESEEIIRYLDNENERYDESKPFFMIWAINPPHNPWTDESTDMDTYRKYYDTDKYPDYKELLTRENVDMETASYVRHYFSAVTSVDKYIGDVLAHLETKDLLDNTIVVFSSDHGEMLGSHAKQGKNIFKTEALAIPFIVRWPEVVKSGKTDLLFGVTDVMPTIMGLAGLQSYIPSDIDGTDYSSFLVGDKPTVKKPESVLLLLGNGRGVQTDRYTLGVEAIKPSKKECISYIYDNLKDPYQLNRLSLDQLPKVSKRLLKDLSKKLKDSNDPWAKQKRYGDLIPY